MSDVKKIAVTESLCPICMKKLEAEIVSEAGMKYMVKTCPEHGEFRTIIWKGNTAFESWVRNKERAFIENPITQVEKGCPYDCGLCSEHRQHTCTALIEVTQNCNLHCSFCFADSYASKEGDPSLEDIKLQYESVFKASGKCNIQLSGGEPTTRDDLPEIVRMGVESGFSFIQINTNGIRLAEDVDYVKALKEAGLSSVFLQFDGTNDDIYKKLRGKAIFEKKVQAIENCNKFDIGVVLVPTLVPGINISNIAEIISFGIKNIPTVRGVHFQPVSYFGRVPFAPKDEDRITLPEVMDEIVAQTEGAISLESLKPPGCENALCSFHGNYIVEGNSLVSVTKRTTCCCSTEKAEEGAVKAIEFVSRNWSNKSTGNDAGEEMSSDWDKILNTIQKQSFSISAMAFQDVWNVNIERIKDCCIHVVSKDGKLIPFCMYNITNAEGISIYRK